jgi:ketosteroid isomerase-like protein
MKSAPEGARYAAAYDSNYDADAIADLSTEDAVWDGDKFGKAEGRENIRRFFRRAPGCFPFAIHNLMNPRIGVDGDRATGQWYLMQPATRQPGTQAVWLAAVYYDEYVRVSGKWLFKRPQLSSNFLTPYEHGCGQKVLCMTRPAIQVRSKELNDSGRDDRSRFELEAGGRYLWL